MTIHRSVKHPSTILKKATYIQERGKPRSYNACYSVLPHYYSACCKTHMFNAMQNIWSWDRHDSFVKNNFLYYHIESGLWHLPGRLNNSFSKLLSWSILSNQPFVLPYFNSTLSSYFMFCWQARIWYSF